MSKHTIYYKNIPVADCTSSGKFSLYNDLPTGTEEFVKVLYPRLRNFLKGSLPEGWRSLTLLRHARSTNWSYETPICKRVANMLAETCSIKQNKYSVVDLASMLDEFTCDISIDRQDHRTFAPIPDEVSSAVKLNNRISDEEYYLYSSKRSTVPRQISFSGFWDKFTAVLEEGPEEPVLRECDRQKEVGNVIVNVKGNPFEYLGVNEAFCTGLAEKCGIDVPRHWTVVLIPNLPSKSKYWRDKFARKHYVSERFGIHRGEDGCVERDLIFNTDILLGIRRFEYCSISDYCSISSEDYISFMRSLLSEEDIQKFLRAYLYGFVIGNNNMHVNNFSVRYTGSGYALTPIYGMISYKSLYQHAEDIALSVSGKKKVTSKAFAKLMLDNGLSRNDIAEMCEMVMDNLDSTALKYIDMNNDKEQSIYTEIRKYAESRCTEMLHSRCLKKKYSKEEQCLEISR